MALSNLPDINGIFNSEIAGEVQELNFALFSKVGTNVLALFGAVDTFPQEDHNVSVEMTDYPVETGAFSTDHSYVLPKTLQLRGYVSDVIVPDFTTVFGDARGAIAFNRIIRAIEKREVTTVITSKYTYKNMLITGFNPRVDTETGSALIFDLFFRELAFVNTETTKLPNRSGVAKDKAANENTGESQAQTPPGSVADQILNKASKYFKGI